MQINPSQTGTQRRNPIEPAGFFTGVQIRPVIVGVVVDYIATYAAMYAYFFVYLAQELSKEGEISSDKIVEYMTSSEGLMVGFAIGVLGTAVGGFVAGWKAGNLEAKHGAFVGVGSLIVSFIEQLLREEGVELPEWFRALSVLAIIPAGALGGYVAEIIKGSRVSYPPTSGNPPRSWPR
jgi:putative membrane protein (TIGR04086 family)